MTDFTRTVRWTPAFDRRDPDPKKNYGIHGVEILWALRGPHGAVQFQLYTNWQLPHVHKERGRGLCGEFCMNLPMPADLGYHSPVPHYEGQTATTESCEVLDGKPCYCGGSTRNAETPFDVLVSEGEDALWKYLENYYAEVFPDD